MKKLPVYFTTSLFFLFFLLPACSAQIPPINVDADSVAIKGYDPVAYFTEGRPV
ncbi:MAG: YHS domain protein, partial [Deltaproteobacteria bacterium]|nr:YHS domain protein [Deltaproteobacteria bacterium]